MNGAALTSMVFAAMFGHPSHAAGQKSAEDLVSAAEVGHAWQNDIRRWPATRIILAIERTASMPR